MGVSSKVGELVVFGPLGSGTWWELVSHNPRQLVPLILRLVPDLFLLLLFSQRPSWTQNG
jgi:hypothetical protein